MRPNNIVRRNWLTTTNTLLIVALAGALFFLLGRLWQRSYRRPVVQATPGHTVIHNRPRSQRGGRSKKHLNFQGGQRDPLGVYPLPVRDLSPAPPRYHAYGYGYPPPRLVPTSAEIGVPKNVGLLIPVGGDNEGGHLGDYSHLPLYKNRFDRRGFRFGYFTIDNGARIYLRSQKDGSKTCHRNSGTDGCMEFMTGDEVQLSISDAVYRVELHPPSYP